MAKKYTAVDLQDWIFNKALNASGATARKIIAGNVQRKADFPLIGKLYFFKYFPKGYATLPVYDKFPLVLPIEYYSDSILGLNLHYLSGGERKLLLDKLLEYRSNERWDETTKIRMSYTLLSGSKRLESLGRPCIKKYLFTHLRSKFIEIMPDEYDIAIQLPVAQFVYNS